MLLNPLLECEEEVKEEERGEMNKPTELQFEELFGGEKEPEQEEEDENSPENEANGEHEYVELHKLDAQGRIKERKSKAVKDEANGDEKINRIVTPPNGKRKLTLDDFQLLKLVGKGGYGKVSPPSSKFFLSYHCVSGISST